MHQFNYQRATSASDARERFQAAADPVYISGGMTLLPSLKLRLANPSDVIDLGGIESMRSITSSDSVMSVGALATHSEVSRSTAIPALAALASGIGDAQVRNCGTLGGSLANNDPAADYPAAVVALGATIHTTGRAHSSDEFFTGLFETSLEEGEIITHVDFPIPSRATYAKFANQSSRFAVVGVMVAETSDGFRVGVTGAGDCAYRQTNFEDALNNQVSPDALDGIEVDSSEFNEDLHASAAYRGNLVTVMAKRAVTALLT